MKALKLLFAAWGILAIGTIIFGFGYHYGLDQRQTTIQNRAKESRIETYDSATGCLQTIEYIVWGEIQE